MSDVAMERHITTGYGMSGWYALEVIENDIGQLEPKQTGYGRYRTQEEAENEAREWAECERLEFRS